MAPQSKVKRAIYYKELGHVLHGLEKKLMTLKNRSYAFFPGIKKRKLKNEILDTDISKSFISQLLVRSFGNFSAYEVKSNLKDDLVKQANAICEHKFSLLGAETQFKTAINWHCDFKTGFEWPKGSFYLNYKQVDLSNNADVKIPRELSRSHHLLILGQAYLSSGDEKYAREFKEQIEHWINDNPLMFSINWGCTMDVAIRAANWVYALNMFINSSIIDENFLKRILVSLYEHGWFIYENLERSFKYNSNHYDGDIGGLVVLGILFKNTKRGEHWLQFSRYAVFDEIRKQIYPSGMELEKSSYYNRLVLEIFSYSTFLLKRNNFQIPADIEQRLYSMFVFINELSFKNKELPIFGDNDSARFLPFDKIYRTDIKYICDIGHFYFGDEIFENSSTDMSSEVFFLLTNNSGISYKALNKYTFNALRSSKIFPDVGIVKMISDNITVLINNSSPGRFVDDPFAGGSHAHADLLSFVLNLDATQLFVDPGSFVYTSDYKQRNLFRSTKMHNTISVDDKSQFGINEKELFYYNTKSEVLNVLFEDTEISCIYQGSHKAYEYIEKELEHNRVFLLDKKNKTLNITDSLSCKHNHTINLHFHLHPNIIVKENSGKFIFEYEERKVAEMYFEKVPLSNIVVSDSFYSPAYGSKIKTKAIDICFDSNTYKTIKTIIQIF